jgi:hypothetical protein
MTAFLFSGNYEDMGASIIVVKTNNFIFAKRISRLIFCLSVIY